jgi:ABC-type transport system substrate-binding protein
MSKDEVDGAYEAYVAGTWAVHEWPTGFRTGGNRNSAGVRDPELDRLIDAQAAEFDEGKRARLIQEVQRRLLRQLYVIPTITFAGYRVQQPWVYGWVENAGALPNNPDWSQAWVDVSQAPTGR